jgi:hypothetical protein
MQFKPPRAHSVFRLAATICRHRWSEPNFDGGLYQWGAGVESQGSGVVQVWLRTRNMKPVGLTQRTQSTLPKKMHQLKPNCERRPI